MTPLLSIENISITFISRRYQTHAVRSLSLDIEKGEILGIVGESGSGKSVLMKSLLRLNREDRAIIESGRILYKEQDLLALSKKEIRHVRGNQIAMVFQDPLSSLNPTMRIGHQIIESLLAHKKVSKLDAKKQALELLAALDITNPDKCYTKYPHELSGGQRQRVMIACSMITKPDILICDEITTALDATTTKQMLQLLKKLQETHGTTIVFITHDLKLARSLCDRVAVMYAGEIVEIRKTPDLFSNPLHPYTQALIGAETLVPIPGNPPSLFKEPKGCPFAARCKHAMHICNQESPKLENESARCFLCQKKEVESV